MIKGLKPYSEYKDSGQEWLGSLPSHWGQVRAKVLFREVDDRSRTGKEEMLSVSHLTGVTPRSQKTITMFLAKSNVGHKVCQPDDLVINTMWAWMGALGVTRHAGIVSPAYGVYRLLNGAKILPRYVDYLLRTPFYAKEYERRSTGVNSSRLRLYPEQFLRIPVVVPSPEEQDAIIRFLDFANGRIERTIGAKKKLVALLNEQKQAIINRAVTRGLNPNVSLKPSGIPWFAQIPNHWGLFRLKNLATKFGSGVTPRGGASVYQKEGIPLLRSQNVHFGELRLDPVAYISREVHDRMAGTHVKPGDVLLNITGASIGRVCSVPNNIKEANVNQHVCIIRPIQGRCSSEYLVTFLSTQAAQTAIYIGQNGSSREGLPLTEVKALPIILPPLEEQEQIAITISCDTKAISKAIRSAENEIGLLREYKSRLGIEVVTGKLDVREAANRLPSEATEPEGLPDLQESDALELEEAEV